jgi:hypothetical protein
MPDLKIWFVKNIADNVASRRRLAEHWRGQMCRSADASGGAETKERTRDAALTRLLGDVNIFKLIT